MKDKILLFGGTTEGRELAAALKSAGIVHTVSVATEYGEEILRENGEEDLLVGRKNSEEIKQLIQAEDFSIVVDATHPFATVVTSEIRKACDGLGTVYLRLSRNTGTGDSSEDFITYVPSLDEGISELAKTRGNILLLTGSKELGTIAKGLSDSGRLFARVLPNEDSIKKCNEAGLAGKQIIAMQGPFSREMNIALIKEIDAKVLLTKESGRTGGFFEKLQAAKESGIKAVVIRNPESMEEASEHYDLNEVIGKLSELTGKEIASFGKDDKDSAKKRITLVGIGPGKESYLTWNCKEALDNADIIFGAESVAGRLKDRGIPVISKYRGEEIEEFLAGNPQYKNPVVVYSGDISLCSGAKTATEYFEKNGYEVERISGISSVTLLAGRLGISLEEVRIVSAHGRSCNVNGYVNDEPQLIILPSDISHAADICRGLLNKGIEISAGYELGSDLERIYKIDSEGDLDELTKNKGGKIILYVKNPNAVNRSVISGLRDDEIIRTKVPMTKEEIRALSMRKLALTRSSVFIDVGAGTGSISLEAALLSPEIRVISVEKNEEAIALLKQNREKFSLTNMEIAEGTDPDA